jgi:hydrogenase/urease accessory protein HupE
MSRGRNAVLLIATCALLCGAWSAPADGHGLDPALLALKGTGPGRFDVTWRTAAQRLPGTNLQPILPARCRQVGTSTSAIMPDHIVLRWSIDCGPGGLAGDTISVRDLDAARINTLLRIEEAGRPTIQVVLHPRRAFFAVPAEATWADVLRDYARLGIEHMLTGADHLLFVFGLLLLLPTARLLIQTITAFTLGHSITLSAAALGLAAVPSRPIEVLIALSVLALTVELSRDVGDDTPMRRFPWLMALSFGLLHGFGFAGALAETGLAPTDVPVALMAFNSGIEIGQLGFVAVVSTAGALARRWIPDVAGHARGPAVYAMGILAVFWCLDRTVAWLG